jgi:hypothetical protein
MIDLQVEKIPGKTSLYWRGISIIAMVAIVFCLQGCRINNKNGAATPDQIVEQYLLALETKDEKLLIQLTPQDVVIPKAMKAKIIRIGGYKIKDRQTTYLKSTPSLWSAKLKGSYVDRQGKDNKFEDSIVIQYQSKGEVKLYAGRWYLLLEGIK